MLNLKCFPAGGFDPSVRKEQDPWRRALTTHPSILARESHGQKSLAGYSP